MTHAPRPEPYSAEAIREHLRRRHPNAFPTAPSARAHHRIVVLLAYLPLVQREIDRGLEDDTITFFIAVVFIVGAVLFWGRWTDAFWMWR